MKNDPAIKFSKLIDEASKNISKYQLDVINEYYNWVLDKRGYLYQSEIGEYLGEEYSYDKYMKEMSNK